MINVFSDVDWSEEQVDAAISLYRDAGIFKVAEHVSRRRERFIRPNSHSRSSRICMC